MSRICLLLVVLLAGGRTLAAPDVAADPRLARVRAPLTRVLDDSAREGLPRQLLENKVREGLAKGVQPDRIVAVVQGMHQDLLAARTRVRQRLHLKAPPAVLLRALLEARQARIPDATVDGLLGSLAGRDRTAGPPPERLARAVEALTDLTLAGYPLAGALRVVRLVTPREPAQLGRLTSALNRLRRDEGLSAAETVEAVAQGLEGGDKLDRAVRNVQNSSLRGKPEEHGRDSSGNAKKSR